MLRYLSWGMIAFVSASCTHSKPAHQHHHSHSEKIVHHHFKKAEEWAEIFDAPERDRWQQPLKVVKAMKLSSGQQVADIGAGTGYFLPYLAEAVGSSGQVWALDVEAEMVKYMRTRAENEGLKNIKVRKVPTDDPQLSEQSLDAILTVNTWHHIAGRKNYAQKVFQALRPRGAFYIVDFNQESPEGPPKEMRLQKEQVMNNLRAVGFECEELSLGLSRQFVLKALKN